MIRALALGILWMTVALAPSVPDSPGPSLVPASPALEPSPTDESTPVPPVREHKPRRGKPVDVVFGFQQYELESRLPERWRDLIGPTADGDDVRRGLVGRVRFGKRSMQVWLTYYQDRLVTIELSPLDRGSMPDLLASIKEIYGRPDRANGLALVWEGTHARLTYVDLFGEVLLTVTSKQLQHEMAAPRQR